MNAVHSARPPLSVCFGGGGAFGIGFDMGVADGLASGGVEIRRSPMIGTSAGSFTVAALAAGVDFETVADRWEKFAASRPGRLWIDNSPMTESMFQGLHAAPGTEAGTVALRLPWLRREVLSTAEHSLSDVV